MGVIDYFLGDDRMSTPMRVVFYDVDYLSDEMVGE